MKIILIFIIIIFIYFSVYLLKNKYIEKEILIDKKDNIITRKPELSKNKNSEIKSLKMIDVDNLPDMSSAYEITDKEIKNNIKQYIPVVPNFINIKNYSNNSNKQIYELVIEKGQEGMDLAKSKDGNGLFRGFFTKEKKISKHANFKKIKYNTSALISSSMHIASQIVGQYYMDKIDSKLNVISAGIKEISNFQMSEYKSKIQALIVQIQNKIKYNNQILVSEEYLLAEIISLDNLEQKCMELLGQSNNMIESYLIEDKLSYKDYKRQLEKIQDWYLYMDNLMNILLNISGLKHVFYFGTRSIEQSFDNAICYKEQIDATLLELKEWNIKQCKNLNINIDKGIIEKNGKFYKIKKFITSEKEYKVIDDSMKSIITMQINPMELDKVTDLYKKDVRLIKDGEKIFYLPS